LLDCLFVADPARALWTVVTKGSVGEVYNVGGEAERKNIDVVGAICDLVDELAPGPKPARELITFVADRPGHDARYAMDVTKKVLPFFREYFGVPYTLPKLDQVAVPGVRNGAMEDWGLISYGEANLLYDPARSSIETKQRVFEVIAHEIAHQWFGNSVTEKDWHEIWLSEGFATYFTLLFIEHQYGRDEFLEGLRSSKKSVDAFYLKNPGYRLVNDNLKDMKDVTTSQIYQKGSWTLHMLRGVVGTENFWKGIKLYYNKYRDSHATVADFSRIMEEVSGKDLAVFFDQWLFKPGTLKYSGNWRFDPNKRQVTIKLDQIQTDGSIFKMPMEIAVYYPGLARPQMQTVQADSMSNVFSISVTGEPDKVVLDPNMWILMDADFRKAD